MRGRFHISPHQIYTGHLSKKKKTKTKCVCWLTSILTFLLPRLHRLASLPGAPLCPCPRWLDSQAAWLLRLQHSRLRRCRPLLLTATRALTWLCEPACCSVFPAARDDAGGQSPASLRTIAPSVCHADRDPAKALNSACSWPNTFPVFSLFVFWLVFLWKRHKSSSTQK